MPGARELRLKADHEHLQQLARRSGGTIAVESARGRPPDDYVIVFRCRGIERLEGGKPVYRQLHRVHIRLPARYPAPSAPPAARMLTPLFHPHVYPDQTICIGFWQTTENLESFVLRLGDMLRLSRQYLNVKDPANQEAMDWLAKNLILTPTDNCTFGVEQAPLTPEAPQEEGVGWSDLG